MNFTSGLTFVPTLSLDGLLLVVVTALLAYSTYLMYKANKGLTLSQIKPVIIAWLREREKGLGIYVQSVGNGTAFNGTIICKTQSGEAKYGFTRMFVGQVYEYPITDQPPIPYSNNDKRMTVEIRYEDIEGNKYDNQLEIDLAVNVRLGQV